MTDAASSARYSLKEISAQVNTLRELVAELEAENTKLHDRLGALASLPPEGSDSENEHRKLVRCLDALQRVLYWHNQHPGQATLHRSRDFRNAAEEVRDTLKAIGALPNTKVTSP